MNPLLIRRRGMMAQGGLPEFHGYLIFDGIAFIDTDITVPTDCSIRLGIGNESSQRQMRVFRVLSGGSGGMIYINITNFTSTTRTLVFCYEATSGQVSRGSNTGSRVGVAITPHKCITNNSATSNSSGGYHPQGGLCIGGFSGDTFTSYYPYNGKMSSIWVYAADAQNVETFNGFTAYTPVYTLTPCIYNGEAGLWCKETNRFYGNSAGAGTLTVDD